MNIHEQDRQELEGILNRVENWGDKRLCDLLEGIAKHLSAYDSSDTIFDACEQIRLEFDAVDRRMMGGEVGDMFDHLSQGYL